MNQKCGITACDENHSKHYCKLCRNSNSDHLASNCSTGIELYHGTKVSNISSISLNGLSASSSGRLGPGLYLTTREEAFRIAGHRGEGTGTAVIKVKVNLGSCCFSNDDANGSWSKNYDSAWGNHPSWAGNREFKEWVLKDASRCRITGFYLIDGIIDGEINSPRTEIIVKGNCTFNGNITTGSLIIG